MDANFNPQSNCLLSLSYVKCAYVLYTTARQLNTAFSGFWSLCHADVGTRRSAQCRIVITGKSFFFKSYFIQLNNKEIKFGKHSNEQCCDWNLVWNMMIMSFNLNWWVWTFNSYLGSSLCLRISYIIDWSVFLIIVYISWCCIYLVV